MRAVSRRRSDAQRPSAESTPLARGQRMLVDLELVGDRRGVHRAGAAERHQREAARVDSALDGDHAQRPHHLLVGDPHDALGGLGSEPELLSELRDRRLRGLGVEADAPPARSEPPGSPSTRLASVTVGSVRRRARSRRARLGARRARPDPQRAAGVAPADRAAAGADRVHVDHRQLDHAPVDLARVGR